MTVTVYHNPACGTSRNVLAILREKGIEPRVIEYLKTPLTRAKLVALIKKMKIPVRELIRTKEKEYSELWLEDPKWTDDQLIDFMVRYPTLMNRPVVVSGDTAKLCRPAEAVLELVD